MPPFGTRTGWQSRAASGSGRGGRKSGIYDLRDATCKVQLSRLVAGEMQCRSREPLSLREHPAELVPPMPSAWRDVATISLWLVVTAAASTHSPPALVTKQVGTFKFLRPISATGKLLQASNPFSR